MKNLEQCIELIYDICNNFEDNNMHFKNHIEISQCQDYIYWTDSHTNKYWSLYKHHIYLWNFNDYRYNTCMQFICDQITVFETKNQLDRLEKLKAFL